MNRTAWFVLHNISHYAIFSCTSRSFRTVFKLCLFTSSPNFSLRFAIFLIVVWSFVRFIVPRMLSNTRRIEFADNKVINKGLKIRQIANSCVWVKKCFLDEKKFTFVKVEVCSSGRLSSSYFLILFESAIFVPRKPLGY